MTRVTSLQTIATVEGIEGLSTPVLQEASERVEEQVKHYGVLPTLTARLGFDFI